MPGGGSRLRLLRAILLWLAVGSRLDAAFRTFLDPPPQRQQGLRVATEPTPPRQFRRHPQHPPGWGSYTVQRLHAAELGGSPFRHLGRDRDRAQGSRRGVADIAASRCQSRQRQPTPIETLPRRRPQTIRRKRRRRRRCLGGRLQPRTDAPRQSDRPGKGSRSVHRHSARLPEGTLPQQASEGSAVGS